MRLYNLTYHDELHLRVSIDYLIDYLRQQGVSMPPITVMIIQTLDRYRNISRDNLYTISRVE